MKMLKQASRLQIEYCYLQLFVNEVVGRLVPDFLYSWDLEHINQLTLKLFNNKYRDPWQVDLSRQAPVLLALV